MRRFTVISAAVVMIVGLAAPALAGSRFELYEEVFVDDFTIPAGGICEFPVDVYSVLDWHERQFIDKKTGEVTHIKIRGSGHSEWTGPGATATENFHWNATFYPDTGVVKQVGNHFSLHVPGMGVVFNESGKAVYNDYTGEVYELRGPHPWVLGEWESLCNAIG